jgi:hypothetical protein
VAVVELVAAVLLVAAAAVYLLRPWWSWRALLARRVVVNLKSGRAISGLLVRRTGDLLFIRDAVALEPGAEPAPADGEAVVARADIDFIQAL